MVRLLYATCRDVGTPVMAVWIQGGDIGNQVRSGQVLLATPVHQPAIQHPTARLLAETHALRGSDRAPAGSEATLPTLGLSWGTWYGSGTSASSG